MSLFQRAATFAAASLCLLGLSFGTAGKAAEPASAGTATIATVATVAAPLISPMLTAAVLTTATRPVLAVPALPEPGTVTAAPPTRFASLEDAVAAEGAGTDAGDGLSDEVHCLAGAIYFEAKGEPLSGQLAVANVIMNRAKSGRFPADVCGVVTQHGQFSFVRDGRVPAIDAAARGYRTAVALARVALAATWDSAAPDALFFHARRVSTGRGVQVAQIGNHVFYR